MAPSGITERFMRNGWKMECMNFWYNHSLVYKNDFSKVRHPFPFMLVQPQFETEQIMEDYLAEKGIEVQRNIELLKISKQDASLNLDFRNIDNDVLFHKNIAGIIIGADGNKSKVRSEANINFEGREYDETYTLYDIELNTSLSEQEGHYLFFKEGAMIMLPIKNGVWRVGGNLKDTLNHLPKGTKTGAISWETTFKISEMVADKYSSGNIHLLGDAAHIHSPLGAKGMNMCIEDSFVFANLFHQNKAQDFSTIRRRKVKHTIGMLGQLTETVAGQRFIGNAFRSNMQRFSFLFPVMMPFMRKFLLGLK